MVASTGDPSSSGQYLPPSLPLRPPSFGFSLPSLSLPTIPNPFTQMPSGLGPLIFTPGQPVGPSITVAPPPLTGPMITTQQPTQSGPYVTTTPPDANKPPSVQDIGYTSSPFNTQDATNKAVHQIPTVDENGNPSSVTMYTGDDLLQKVLSLLPNFGQMVNNAYKTGAMGPLVVGNMTQNPFDVGIAGINYINGQQTPTKVTTRPQDMATTGLMSPIPPDVSPTGNPIHLMALLRENPATLLHELTHGISYLANNYTPGNTNTSVNFLTPQQLATVQKAPAPGFALPTQIPQTVLDASGYDLTGKRQGRDVALREIPSNLLELWASQTQPGYSQGPGQQERYLDELNHPQHVPLTANDNTILADHANNLMSWLQAFANRGYGGNGQFLGP